MPRSKRKREGETTPIAAPPRRRGQRDASGAEPAAAVGRKFDQDDSEHTEIDETKAKAPQDGRPKDPLENDQSNNSPVNKDKGNGVSRNSSSGSNKNKNSSRAGEGNDHAVEPLKENATRPLHEKEDKRMDTTDATTKSGSTEKMGTLSESAGATLDSGLEAILAHRKLLITRLQQGRRVVRNRLELAYKRHPPFKDQTDDQEIASFHQLMKEATSLARKQNKVDTDSGEKRTSVSLRRGSSVGKKMNIALSSLAPGTASMAAAATALAASLGEIPTTSFPPSAPPQKTLSASATTKTATGPTSVPVVSGSMPSLAPGSLALPVQKKMSAPFRTNSKIIRQTASSPRVPVSSNLAPPFTHTNLLGTPSRVTQPIANECILLREKRRTIRNKLSALIPSDIEQSTMNQSKTQRAPIDWQQRAAQNLPPRRKTHWDYLLEEMRWMATDFKQERNWKVAAAHSLSRDMRSKHAETAANAGKMADQVSREGVSFAKISSPPPTAEESTVTMEIDHIDESTDVSVHKHCRGVAKRLSEMITSFRKEYMSVTQIVSGVPCSDDKNTVARLIAENPEQQEDVQQTSNAFRALPESESDKIYKAISELVTKVASITRKTRPSHCKVEGAQIQLSSEQSGTVLFLEEKLSVTQSGAILEGSYSCGKTIAALALVSRTSGDGPHLVVCPIESIVKWVDRAQYFEQIQIRSLASLLEMNSSLNHNDLVLCDLAGLETLPKATLDSFKSIVVDCRHSFGFSGTKPSSNEDIERGMQTVLNDFYPRELASVQWWERLKPNDGAACVRRLLIENKSSNSLADMFGGLGDKAKVELLAARLGFVTYPVSSVGHNLAITKVLIGWARKRIKHKKGEGSKFERVVRELVSVLGSFTCLLSDSEIAEEAPDKLSFDIQKCDMTELQRIAYDDQCASARRALSSSLKEIEADPILLNDTVVSLMKLRRSCIHADLDALLKSSTIRSAVNAFSVTGGRLDSAAQPNQEIASRIMEGSGKFSQLASFLSSETSVNLSRETQNLVWRKDGKRKSAKVKHFPLKNKIVIIATLPDVQILASVFLHSLGVNHEFIPDSFVGDLSTQAFRHDQFHRWTIGQARLTVFNHHNFDEPSAVNVVLCSPTVIAGHHGGVGVDTADAVISIDEDWSGRCEMIFNGLLHRFWCALNKKCRFIKLVAAGTCEEQLLANGDFGHIEAKDILWRAGPLGVFTTESTTRDKKALVSMVDNRQKPESWFGFPGLNVFAETNEPLSEILRTTVPLERRFGSGSPLLFLPNKEGDQEAFVKLIMGLVQTESTTLRDWYDSVVPVSSLIHTVGIVRRLSVCGANMHTEKRRQNDESIEEVDANNGISLGIALADDGVDVTVETNLPSQDENSSSTVGRRTSLYYDSERGISSCVSDRRSNAFVDLFASSLDKERRIDAEALPFFPPLFPRMLEASILAENGVSMLEALGAKRRIAEDSEDHACIKHARAIVTEEDAPRNDGASLLLDLADDYGLAGVGAVPLDHDSILAAALERKDSSRLDNFTPETMVLVVSRKRQRPVSLNALAPSTQLTVGLAARNVAPSNVVLPLARSNPLPKANANAVNLEVPSGKSLKKKVSGPKQGQQVSIGQPQANVEDSSQIIRGQAQATRMKEIMRARYLSSGRQSGVGTSIFEVPSFRGAFVRIRHRLRNCTSRDCWHSSMIVDAGPGLPMQVCKRDALSQGHGIPDDRTFWTSAVKKLTSPTSRTGDEALKAAGAQRTALRRSLSAPSRVDFGPFQSGFLSPPSGMTAVVPPRPRGGVSLPMGVKVPPPTKEVHVQWTQKEERALRDCVLRFGTNWMLAARAMSGFDDVETVSRQSRGIHRLSRAGRSCREHWHVLTKQDADLARELRQIERIQREKANRKFDLRDSPLKVQTVGFVNGVELPGNTEKALSGRMDIFTDASDSTQFMLPCIDDDNAGPQETESNQMQVDPTPTPPKVRSFSAIKAARAKKVSIPRSIPGVPSGAQPTISPSHTSHMQAVQKSSTAKWSGGRTDMWPIQFLDAADRHRTPPLSASPQPPIQPSSSRNQAPTSHGNISSSASARQAYPAASHRMPPSTTLRPTVPPGIGGAPLPTRPVSTSATQQSFTPPSNRARQGDDNKLAPK